MNIATEREKDRGSLKFVFVDPISEETKVRVLLLGAGEILLDEEGTKKTFVSHQTHHEVRSPGQYVHDLHLSPLPLFPKA